MKVEKIKEDWNCTGFIPDYDSNGWTDIDNLPDEYSTIKLEAKLYKEPENGFETTIVRPKSLSGIETNNGWIKIESEDDLPETNEWYWVVKKDGKEMLSGFENIKSNKRWLNEITHYQPITKPKPPIY